MNERAEFNFRVWIYPEDGDPPEIEVWWHGLESTDPSRRFMSEWVSESLETELVLSDVYDLFDLDRDKHWQVVGKGEITGWYDYYGEYDETFDVIEYEKAEVPESFYERCRVIDGPDSESND